METEASSGPSAQPKSGTVREAVAQDAPALAELLVAAWRTGYDGDIDAACLAGMNVRQSTESWANTLARTAGTPPPRVAVHQGMVVGFCQFGAPRDPSYVDGSAGELFALDVLPEQWEPGPGSRLTLDAHEGLRQQGYREANLWVADGNLRSIDPYARHGWRTTGSTKNGDRFTPPLSEHRLGISLRRSLMAMVSWTCT